MISTRLSIPLPIITRLQDYTRTLLTFIEYPLFRIYLSGPRVFGLWAGADIEEVCYIMTGVSSSHWIYNQYQCQLLIERNFRACVIIPYTVMYYIIMLRLFTVVWFTLKHAVIHKSISVSRVQPPNMCL